MPFRYALRPLLRLRECLERQEEQRLFAIAALVARLRAEIEQLKQADMEARRAELREMAIVSHGASLQFAAACGAAFASARKKLEQQLEEAELKRIRQLRVYQFVRQKREVLQALRDRQEAAYDLEFARHEQETADESFLMRTHAVSNE
jgi:flagellar biosynthesis chaperone FliJ